MNKKALIIALSVIAGLCFSECILRVFAQFVRRKPALGLRYYKKTGNDIFILCIGDSVTFGSGCAATDYPRELGKKLSEALHKNVYVENKGSPGRSNQFDIFKDAISEADFDIAIFLMGGGTWNTADYYPYLMKHVSFRWKAILGAEQLLNHFKLYKLIKNTAHDLYYKLFVRPKKDSIDRYLRCVEELGQFRNNRVFKDTLQKRPFVEKFKECVSSCPQCDEAYYEAFDILGVNGKEISPEVNEVFAAHGKRYLFAKNNSVMELKNKIFEVKRQQVEEMIRMCRARNIKPVFLTYPSNHPLGGVESLIRKRAKENDFLVVDLSDYFRNTLKCAICKEYFADDIHPNCKGYEYMADRIASEMLHRRPFFFGNN